MKFPERSRPWFDAATVESQGQQPADYAPLARQYYKLRSGEAACAPIK